MYREERLLKNILWFIIENFNGIFEVTFSVCFCSISCTPFIYLHFCIIISLGFLSFTSLSNNPVEMGVRHLEL